MTSHVDTWAMKMRAETDAALAALDAEIPELRESMNEFFHAFEYRCEQIWGSAAPEDSAYVFAKLEHMIERAGIND